jgi:hypothetical protein
MIGSDIHFGGTKMRRRNMCRFSSHRQDVRIFIRLLRRTGELSTSGLLLSESNGVLKRTSQADFLPCQWHERSNFVVVRELDAVP